MYCHVRGTRAYYVFQANGFEVDIASPQGGQPKVIIDDEDMGEFDYAFLNDSIAQHKAKHTIPVDEIVASDYEAVFFVGFSCGCLVTRFCVKCTGASNN